MEVQELAAEKAPFLDRGEVLKCKYEGLASVIGSSILSIMVAVVVVIGHPLHPTGKYGLDLSLRVLTVAYILLINPVSYFTAHRISKRVTKDSASRKSLTWVIHRGTSNVAFMAIMLALLLAN
jgi:hypothetical protein